MKAKRLFLILSVGFVPLAISGQDRPGDFRITKVSKNLIAAPIYSYIGAPQYRTDANERWLEVEVEFATAPALTDELTFKYFILVNGSLLTGEVTHVNIPFARDNRSVMYAPPDALLRASNNRPLTIAGIQNIAVQLFHQGAIRDELSLVRAPAQWYTTIPAIKGLLLNKDETPFAPLYWSRYVQIKPPGR
jgi:hypothetical protein